MCQSNTVMESKPEAVDVEEYQRRLEIMFQ